MHRELRLIFQARQSGK